MQDNQYLSVMRPLSKEKPLVALRPQAMAAMGASRMDKEIYTRNPPANQRCHLAKESYLEPYRHSVVCHSCCDPPKTPSQSGGTQALHAVHHNEDHRRYTLQLDLYTAKVPCLNRPSLYVRCTGVSSESSQPSCLVPRKHTFAVRPHCASPV